MFSIDLPFDLKLSDFSLLSQVVQKGWLAKHCGNAHSAMLCAMI